jgi:hypothetical protein
MAKPVIAKNLYRMNHHPPVQGADSSAGFSYTIDWTHSRDAVTYPPMQRPHRWFHIGFLLSLLLAATGTSAADFASRSFLNAGGRIIEYTDGEENLALEFGSRINQVFAQDRATLPAPAIELSPAEITQHMNEYLAAISRYLNLPRATPQMMAVLARANLLGGRADPVADQARASLKNFQLWRENDLMARLNAGLTVAGLTKSADGKGYEIKPPKNLSDFDTWPLPIVITSRDQETVAELVEKKIAEARQALLLQARAQSLRISIHSLLQEAVETALVENYIASKDRRWFCAGVACYVAYKVIEDKVGPEAALRYYDIDAQLPLYGDMKPVANLEKWALAEDQSPEIRGMRANQANTVFAAEVFFNLTAQHGPEFIPKLLAEIGKTRRDKANLKTIYRAYKNLQHEELRPYLPNAY